MLRVGPQQGATFLISARMLLCGGKKAEEFRKFWGIKLCPGRAEKVYLVPLVSFERIGISKPGCGAPRLPGRSGEEVAGLGI